MGRTRNARPLHRTLLVSVFAFVMLVAVAPMAAADPCPPLDLGCVVDATTTPAGGVVDDTTTTVGGVVDDTTTTVGGVVDDTTTTVGRASGAPGPIDPATIVEGITPAGTLPGGGSLPGTGETPPSGGTTPTNGAGTPHTGTAASGSQGSPPAIAATAGSGAVVPTASGRVSTVVSHPFPGFLDAGNGALLAGARVVRTLAFPLVLILLVVGFVFVQNRIDRKDPKLALAPVGSDLLTFS